MFTIGRVLFVFTHFVLMLSYYTTITVSLDRFFQPQQPTLSLSLKMMLTILNILSITSYYRAGFTDAGPITATDIPMGKDALCDQLSKICEKCKAWKPPRAHHCKTCKRCVFRMDHHCEWVNNCVGSHNQKYFILFLYYTFLMSLLVFLINIMGFVYWLQMQRRGIILALLNITYTKVQVGSVLLLSVFFTLFTGDFLYCQIEVVLDNQTTVESHKDICGKPGKFMDNMRQIFGKRNIYWFLPTKPKLEMNYMELMYDVAYAQKGALFLEDQFENESSQFHIFFQEYRVK